MYYDVHTCLYLVYTHLKLKWNLNLFFMYFYIFELLHCSTFEQSEAYISRGSRRKSWQRQVTAPLPVASPDATAPFQDFSRCFCCLFGNYAVLGGVFFFFMKMQSSHSCINILISLIARIRSAQLPLANTVYTCTFLYVFNTSVINLLLAYYYISCLLVAYSYSTYSGAKKYLVSQQLCKFSHLRRWERPVIFIIGIPQLWETNKKSRKSHCRIFREFICKLWWKISIWSITKFHLNTLLYTLCWQWQRSNVFCKSSQGFHTLLLVFWPIASMQISSRAVMFWGCRWATRTFNSLQSRGGKSTKIFYSSKSTITLLKFYLSTSKSTSLKIYSSKSKK